MSKAKTANQKPNDDLTRVVDELTKTVKKLEMKLAEVSDIAAKAVPVFEVVDQQQRVIEELSQKTVSLEATLTNMPQLPKGVKEIDADSLFQRILEAAMVQQISECSFSVWGNPESMKGTVQIVIDVARGCTEMVLEQFSTEI